MMTIIVSTHKDYPMLADKTVYLPVQVGGAQLYHDEWEKDDSGDNISEKNSTFCELTALYWAWKNLDSEVLGLCHYRRYLASIAPFWVRICIAKRERILTRGQIELLLKNYDVILPQKRHYWIENRESQYAHAHHIEDLQCMEKVLSERYPEYLPDWNWMLGTRSGHICNLFIMRRELVDAYCFWLFDVLFEAERRLDISTYSDKDKRVFGYLGERLLDVWIQHNRLRYIEVPVINLEKQHWLRKGIAFVKRKKRKL